jgi:DNA-binding transcriptional LysR family regulator
MSLSSLHLDAFYAAAQSLNFSQAARDLHITQSALSQRIKALEEDVNLTLFVRMPRGVQLTEAGERLLRYCQARNSLEEELLQEITGSKHEGLGGHLRIAGYSSIVRSVLIPALRSLLREHPHVQPHFQNAEIRNLPEMLLTGNVDFIVTDTEFHRHDLECIELGIEEYVLVQSTKDPSPNEIYLDHDPEDRISHQFLAHQDREVPTYKRAFLDEIYAIIDAAAMGMGKAVVSRHLVDDNPNVEIVPGYESMSVPVLLYHHKQPFYTELHKATVATLSSECPSLLAINK